MSSAVFNPLDSPYHLHRWERWQLAREKPVDAGVFSQSKLLESVNLPSVKMKRMECDEHGVSRLETLRVFAADDKLEVWNRVFFADCFSLDLADFRKDMSLEKNFLSISIESLEKIEVLLIRWPVNSSTKVKIIIAGT